mmetsp:Transcript_12070/g.33926  ORF Transcript_12070/g.33926 Transcript_12070/m.33926 type:complete len:245 (-) Transcript_12070:221-955(-)|eukprot:CAMPEP_0117691436 /NCGR_PEP_ID=MMETSP0804-20121206/25721_1 /TAXON_ID=1074897 /ORGANISM="Tetraselmis astigmatica, Strain CCMP880" /LENGTH=244 /DNA_ID=CAMNT_0005504673 /DNA_START=312 /DNA_END=1046 /DNA_ORIENTATION=+
MNNNQTGQASLLANCKGVFSATSYITIGSKEKPEPYKDKKAPQRSCYGGKQFNNVPPKDGRTTDVYFEKKHPWLSDGDKYVDKLRYKDTQPEKKKGFLSGDFKRRDEFSNTVRTLQYREQLKGEEKQAKKQMEMITALGNDTESAALQSSLAMSQTQAPAAYLYDLVYEKDDPTRSGASKVARDTKNPTVLSFDRSAGVARTTTALAFQAPDSFSKPTYARKPLVKDTFYRKTNCFPDELDADA